MELNKPVFESGLTLGSLFDGSGGFPLGGIISGIKPVWASEVEPFPIRVTTKRLPFMKHYGDVSKMNGGEIEPVDIITFGSPCQDMSVAGKRAGLDGSRSNLFYEAVRIVKEMRCATDGKYPRWICWENVPGAFSSNKGEDFKAVLDSICKIKDETCDVPECKKWESAGEILGDDFSVAWRVLDAQFWGVPQRRKRIFLVADFAGRSAGQILFESEGLSGYSAEGFRSWQGIACRAENCADKTGVVLNDQGGNRMDVTHDMTSTLRAEAHHPPCVMESAGFCTEHSAKARSIGFEEEMSPTLRAGVVPATVYENHSQDTRYKDTGDVAPTVLSTYGTGGNNQPFVVGTPKTLKIRCGCDGGGKGALIQEDRSATLSCNNDQTLFEPKSWDGSDVSPTLTANNAGGNQRMPDKDNFNCVVEAYGICSKDSNSMKSDNPHSGFYKADSSRCLDGNGGNPTCNQGGIAVVEGIPFTQNQRDEVRILGDKSGALCKAATKQQTYVLQGSMIGRKDENGPQGDGVNKEISFTLNTADRHAVYAMTTGEFTQVCEEKSPTLMARDYKDPNIINEPSAYGIGRDAMNQGKNALFSPAVAEEVQPTLVAKGPGAVAKCEPEYTVRRLTPTECARLQGFPDWWCADLGTDTPTYGEISFWSDVFETHRLICGTSSKPKSQKQIISWLKNPYSDSAEYKMWGNGIALPCVYFILSGIVWAASNDNEKSSE
ncbi:MAG: putative BsuMI modification methylase subunit YdiP [Firmicutes bacterium ADurb.Bin193]|nr:MAG: putative BsuMI modification methylase subunit YdiP [Firmicutes bacterium ADurb.Bin193]